MSSHLSCTAVAGTVLYIDDSRINTVLVERILTSRPDVVFGSAPDASVVGGLFSSASRPIKAHRRHSAKLSTWASRGA